MAYNWDTMYKVTFGEVIEAHAKGEIGGYYYLYDDDTEAEIDENVTVEELTDMYNKGAEFGYGL